MRKEYDLSDAEPGGYAERFTGDVHYVAIDPDVAEFFNGTEAINEALRALMIAIKASSAGKKPA